VRPESQSKPAVSKLRERGVEIRTVDVVTDGVPALEAALKGVDIVISTVIYTEIHHQLKLADAAKLAGVKRFVTDDWGTACVRGVRQLFDQKAKIQDYVKSIGLGYTFIDVGFWASLLVPVEKESQSEYPEYDILICNSHAIIGTGDVKTAITNRPDIGKFVAEIVGDERTLNRYVFCWGDEKSQNELWEIARKVKVEQGGTLNISPKKITKEEIEEAMKSSNASVVVSQEYYYSMFIRGDNTIANAKKPEYGNALDARELYPNLKVSSAEDFTRQLYSN